MLSITLKGVTGNLSSQKPPANPSIQEIMNRLKQSDDFVVFQKKRERQTYILAYFSSLVNTDIIHQDILPYMTEDINVSTLADEIAVEDVIKVKNPSELLTKLPQGYVYIHFLDQVGLGLLIVADKQEKRSITAPEVEFSVVGPKESFIESIETNRHLVRKRLPVDQLIVEKVIVGTLSKTEINILYLKNVASQENTNTVRQRLKELEFDAIGDSAYISQMIADNQRSPFPQILDTERPDRVATSLAEGKVAILVDHSPHALIAPTSFVESISTFEDYLLNPYAASFIRLLRVCSIAFSILITPIYVATLTYHYELIPKDLLATLITSRRAIPLPPILEALFLELTIELLREAGARLPNKVGQTIGIVGGIVIGTASVEAGLTSNVLLIMVALAALASFTTPTYQFGNTIRLIRFPFLLACHFWGLIGLVLCFSALTGHLLRLTSLGRPYLEPLYPFRVQDMKDSIVRLPFTKLSQRPFMVGTKNEKRFRPHENKIKRDIDE